MSRFIQVGPLAAMKSAVHILTCLLVFCGCKTPKESSQVEEKCSRINLELIQDSAGNKLYSYPNLTAWGHLTISMTDEKLVVLNARNNAELGYKERTYYINKGEIDSVLFASQIAMWSDYERRFPPDRFPWMSDSMKYMNSSGSFAFDNEEYNEGDSADFMKKDGKRIIQFLLKEKIIAANNL